MSGVYDLIAGVFFVREGCREGFQIALERFVFRLEGIEEFGVKDRDGGEVGEGLKDRQIHPDISLPDRIGVDDADRVAVVVQGKAEDRFQAEIEDAPDQGIGRFGLPHRGGEARREDPLRDRRRDPVPQLACHVRRDVEGGIDTKAVAVSEDQKPPVTLRHIENLLQNRVDHLAARAS